MGVVGRSQKQGRLIGSGQCPYSSRTLGPWHQQLLAYFLFLIIFPVLRVLGSDSCSSLKSGILLQLGELASGRDELPNYILNTMCSALKPYTHNQQKWTQKVLFIYLCIHIHTCLTRRNWKGRIWEGMEKRQGRGKLMYYVLI